jgi:hypothetical protein
LAGATTQTYTAPYNGVYSVIATDVNFCNSMPSNTINVTQVGIELLKNYTSLLIYPNPSTGLVTIEINDLKLNTTVDVINGFGQIIHQSFIKECTTKCIHDLDLSDFANGIYFVKITSGNEIEYRKLVISVCP